MFKLTNNEKRFFRFPLTADNSTVKELVLSPGANLVSDENYEVVSKLKAFKNRLKSQVRGVKFPIKSISVEELSSQKKESKKSDESDEEGSSLLSELTVADAKEIVDETMDLQTLKKWEAEEGRSTLKKYIKDRFDELMSEYDEGDESSKDDE